MANAEEEVVEGPIYQQIDDLNFVNGALRAERTLPGVDKDAIDSQINANKAKIETLSTTLLSDVENEKDRYEQTTGSLTGIHKAINASDDQITKVEDDIDFMEEDNINIIRKIQFTDYYSKRNDAYIDVIKKITIIIMVYIFILMIQKQDMIDVSPGIIYILLFVLSVIGIILIMIDIFRIIYRDNMNFDKFTWPFWFPDGKTDNIGVDGEFVSNVRLNALTSGICFGELCCNDVNTQWNSSSGKCEYTGT